MYFRHVMQIPSTSVKCVAMRWVVTVAHKFYQNHLQLNYARCTPRVTMPPALPPREHILSWTFCYSQAISSAKPPASTSRRLHGACRMGTWGMSKVTAQLSPSQALHQALLLGPQAACLH